MLMLQKKLFLNGALFFIYLLKVPHTQRHGFVLPFELNVIYDSVINLPFPYDFNFLSKNKGKISAKYFLFQSFQKEMGVIFSACTINATLISNHCEN